MIGRAALAVGISVLAFGVLSLGAFSHARAQQPAQDQQKLSQDQQKPPADFEVVAPEKQRGFGILRPEASGNAPTRPPDAGHYDRDTRLNYDPAFIEPLTAETDTGTRYGLSGWSSPWTQGDKPSESLSAGWLSWGFSITWGGPTPAERRAAGRPVATPGPVPAPR